MKSRTTFIGGSFQPVMDTWEVERQEFLNLPRLPAIITDVQTGWLLGFTAEAVGILVRDEFLKPLGGAGPDDSKRFSSAYIGQLSRDRDWLDEATDAIYASRAKSTVIKK
jgi:hypothetical protein